MDTITLKLSVEDARRLLSGVRERRRKAEKGLTKYKDEFDPEKGAGLRNAYDTSLRLERYIQGKINADDNTRQPPAHRNERQGRGPAPGVYREAGLPDHLLPRVADDR